MTQAAFWDRMARDYFRKPIDDVVAYQQTIARVGTHLKPSDRVLELGCGTGGTAVLLAPHVARWTASDFSSEMIRCARERLANEAAPTNIDVRVAGADEFEQEGPYDAVCAFNLLHLVPSLSSTIRGMRAALAPAGLAITKTPCLGERGLLIRAVLPVLRALGRAPRVEIFDSAELESAFIREGFEILESCTFGEARTDRFLVARPNR